ncbi:hypothetical protein D9611_015140 [Ephemerocybe angulata]|uniref:Uncharacterized protein n=1 Tax=Ephemerocybe angulata TaxID=980116 RepID=A0A8H5C2N4_9AGAR|nr:hypothetical protein D9611_015140 [Tulosesus angulatus]
MPTNLSIYDWHDSLKLATKYNIEPVRKRAIEAIDGEDRYWYRHKIEWGLEYHVKSFIVDGSTAAVNALLDSTLNLGLSMSELGGASRLQTVVKLFWIEKALRSPDSVYHPHPQIHRQRLGQPNIHTNQVLLCQMPQGHMRGSHVPRQPGLSDMRASTWRGRNAGRHRLG